MEQKQKVERQAFLVRWLVAAVVAVLVSDSVSPLLIGVGLAIVGAYTAVFLWAAGDAERYEKHGRWARIVVCGGDVFAASLAIAVSHGSVPNLYVLYVLPITWSGFVARRTQTILLMTAASLVGNAAATLIAHPGAGPGADAAFVRAGTVTLLIAAGVAGALFVFKQREDAMQRRDRKLSSLLEFGTRFTSGDDVARLMEQTLRAALADTDAAAGYIMLVDETGETLDAEVAVSLGDERAFPKQRRLGEGIEGYVAQTGKPLVLAHEQAEGRTPGADVPSGIHYDGQAVLCVPMVESGVGAAQNGIIGVFTLFKHQRGSRFLPEDVDLVRTVVGLTTMAIVNSRLYEYQQVSFLRSLQAFANTLEAKDSYTRGHSFRVSELCVMMARKLHVAPEMIEDLRNGALLHDVGKIGIPDAVLRKPDKLTEEEFAIMKQHPVIGFEICQPLGLNEGILMLIRNHHEKLDGTGYPDGLKLGELPLLLRIICVADAFDAMSSSRPYRKSMDGQIRNEQLNRFAGTQFDPVVVEALKSLLHNGELAELYKDHWLPRPEEDLSPMLKAA